ncbi:hypothetical protein THIOM_003116 [Candidatus Thiomargarita nelsonii]|uniref:Uncharacterized protein n=1 Tax=Candidatus Thiomargarita nelsonii TaxID=1003181 RepID=A0A176RZ96_9GAMM|nr:hypothetical protein THIOM_003116 [Candidatus Thiomargarita nelsonii]
MVRGEMVRRTHPTLAVRSESDSRARRLTHVQLFDPRRQTPIYSNKSFSYGKRSVPIIFKKGSIIRPILPELMYWFIN